MIIQTITYWLFGRRAIAPAITSARYQAARRAGGRCELTGEGCDLDGHHLFNVDAFPWFAAMAWNIIMIQADLHKEFHQWRGGTKVWCTPMHLWYWWRVVKHPVRSWAVLVAVVVACLLIYKEIE
jgi:hypothetical protein